MSAHIFVVEDEKPIQTLLRYNLEKEGFKVPQVKMAKKLYL